MSGHITSALFVFSDAGKEHIELVEQNPHGTAITSVSFNNLQKNPSPILNDVTHVVICAELDIIKKVMNYSLEYGFSIGLLPLPSQRAIIQCYAIPKIASEAISLALVDEPSPIDLVFCNDKILLFKGSIGRIPLVDNPDNTSKIRIILNGLKDIVSLKLLSFTITTNGSNKATITTAACGCMMFENPERSFASGAISHDSSFTDKMVSTVIVAPFSIVAYFKLMLTRLFSSPVANRIPDSIGHIKSPHFTIDSEKELNVLIDGKNLTKTPLECRVIPAAIRLNHGKDQESGKQRTSPDKEKILIKSLPVGKELLKAKNAKVPFFTYASEERFKDLFIALKDDARIDSAYVVLMILSTILATVGLFLNSSSVIIGAMILAPLMAPIISLAMGLLRYDRKLFRNSCWKIGLGILLALFTAALLTLVSPYQPFTGEMQGRLNPTVLDLIVAIAAGIAGAYTKSFKEILHSLAGVAIAVALVPPLAVAGIGLGRLDPLFFSQAFLLFGTNLIGIILAATITFRVLGFSPVVRDKRAVLIVSLFLVLIAIPLSMAYQGIVERARFEKSWQQERFLVNGKYLIVQEAILNEFHDKKILTIEIHAREQLNRDDLTKFKNKIEQNFNEDIIIRAKITYIP